MKKTVARKSRKPEVKSVAIPVRITAGMEASLDKAASKCGLKKSDVIRLCLEAGLEDLERTGYRLGVLISNAKRNASV